MMNNSQRKREAARKHNMLRIENEAYAEDRARFPKKVVKSSSTYRHKKAMSKAALVGVLAGMGAL